MTVRIAEETTIDARTPWHAIDQTAVEHALGASPRGLAGAESERRLAAYGPNQLEEAQGRGDLAILLHQFRSPLIYILLVAAVLTLLLGKYIDTAAIAAVLILNAIIGFTQERQAERSVQALMQLVAPRARVVRDGREVEIPSREVVPGDLVLLESGARVPADIRLVTATALMVDESLLTGESVPVAKQIQPLPAEALLTDRSNMVYAGSVVTSGRGRGYVVATGARTELGGIAEQVRQVERTPTPLQQRMTRFAHIVGLVVLGSTTLAFALGVALGISPGEMFLVAIALAVATIPEGLPIVFTVTLALGVRRMARRRAILRRLAAVETLGSTTVIGSDKTGTLTENRMTVQQIWTARRFVSLSADEAPPLTEGSPLSLTLLAGVLTNEADIRPGQDGSYETQGDPTEAALLVAAARLGLDPRQARQTYTLQSEIPFEPERQYSAAARARDGRTLIVAKGAPERVLAMCDRLLGEDGPEPLDRDAVQAAAAQLAARGLRVLGMAYRETEAAPRDLDGDWQPHGLVFLGLQGMLDPPREGVPEAVRGCQQAGIRVIMITGDHAETARAIGRELGIGGNGGVLTGADLTTMDDEALRDQVRRVSIYARVLPEQKLRVVQALQHHGEVVAVTGDGVNDAPALKAADIGIAMGQSGTDVAREASDMVLADDNFVSIYAAVEQGRVTFDNVRKVTFFLISTGLAATLTILAVLVLRWPLPFVPAQLLWMNLVTKGLQDIALAFEPGEPDVLKRPPRGRQEGVISPLLWERSVITGIVMAIGTLALFRWELDQGGTLMQAQTVALTTMVISQAFHVGNSRSDYRSLFQLSPISNPVLFIATTVSVAIHIAALYLPPTQFVLRVEPISLDAWVRIVVVSATILVAIELHKLLRRRPPMARDRTPGPEPA